MPTICQKRDSKLILGRFRDAVLPDFSRFRAGSDDNLNAFFTDPRHGNIAGDLSHTGLGFVSAPFVCYIARSKKKMQKKEKKKKRKKKKKKKKGKERKKKHPH